MSDWLSVCCSAPPHYMFEMSGDPQVGFSGLCSACKDNTEFLEYGDDDGYADSIELDSETHQANLDRKHGGTDE